MRAFALMYNKGLDDERNAETGQLGLATLQLVSNNFTNFRVDPLNVFEAKFSPRSQKAHLAKSVDLFSELLKSSDHLSRGRNGRAITC